jgi:acyl-CoA thioesterase
MATEARTNPFDADIAVTPLGDGRFQANLSESWWVGRGPNGGYLTAVLLRALQEQVPDRPPRSISVHFLRPPAAGPAEIELTVDRTGRRATFLSARLVQGGKLQARALAALSEPWPGPAYEAAEMPEAQPPDALPSLDEVGGSAPPFFDNYRAVPAFGDRPFGGGGSPSGGVWLGPAEPRPLDAPLAAAFLDAWFPMPFTLLDGPLPAPTIDYTVHLRAPLPEPGSSPRDMHLAVFRSELARDGFFDEQGELWSPDGRLLAQSRQLALILDL